MLDRAFVPVWAMAVGYTDGCPIRAMGLMRFLDRAYPVDGTFVLNADRFVERRWRHVLRTVYLVAQIVGASRQGRHGYFISLARVVRFGIG